MIAVTFCFCMHLLTLLFVSLILTGLYQCSFPWSKLNKRKSWQWLVYLIRVKPWKLLKWTVASFWWKNLRLTVSKDFNGSILIEKIITDRNDPFNDCKYMKIIYMWTAVEEMIMKAILAVMNTTKLVVKVRPEKNLGPYGIWTHHLCDTG